MAKGWEYDVYEDDACLNCGAVRYHASRVSGICVECAIEAASSSKKKNEQKENEPRNS